MPKSFTIDVSAVFSFQLNESAEIVGVGVKSL